MNVRLFSLLLLMLLSGCANYVAHQIAEPQRQPSKIVASEDYYQNVDLQRHDNCQAPCIHYVSGTPWTAQPPNNFAAMDIVFGGNTEISPAPFSVKGTVVLLHGYGANWSYMLPWSFYFQSRGFHTYMPDLPGQASTSVSDFSYGTRDVNYLKPWFLGLNAPRPLIIVGHSMGTISATYLAKALNADALVLLAPSSPLKQAAPGAARAFHPILSLLIPNSSINAGTQQALQQLKIADVDTDLRAMLAGWAQPTLVVSAAQDEVIATDWPAQLNSLQMQRHQRDGNHVAVLKPDSDAQQLMDNWLKTALSSSMKLPAAN